MTKKIDIEKLIEQAIKEEIESAPPPPLSTEEAWKKLQQRMKEINKNKRKAVWLPKPIIYATVIILFVIATIIWTPANGFAYSKLTEIYHKIQGSVVQIFTKVSEPMPEQNNLPISGEFTVIEESETESLQISLEEAEKITAFPIVLPKFLPPDFSLENVTVIKNQNEDKGEKIYLNYKSAGESFSIGEFIIKGEFSSGMVIDGDDVTVKSVSVNGREATLLTYKNNTRKLIWVDQSHYYSIFGELTEEDILQIAKSM